MATAWPTLETLERYIDPLLKEFIVVDLFCGAGGASQGTLLALERLGITAERLRARGWRLRLINVNHWEPAIETIKQNLCFAEMFNASIENVDPSFTLQGKRPHLLIAAAECIMYSKARGHKQIRDQSRTTAAWILDWVKTKPHALFFENVPEWRTWGPLDKDLQPLPETAGAYYDAFLSDVRSEGYTVCETVVNCANYGDATTRQRLFILGMHEDYRYNASVPTPTHTEFPESFPDRKPWVPVRDIINWNLKGAPITHRQRGPHALPTLRRVRHGYKKQRTVLSALLVEIVDRMLPIAERFHKYVAERPTESKLGRKLTKHETLRCKAMMKHALAAAQIEVKKAFATPLGEVFSRDLTPEQVQAMAVILGQHSGSVARTEDQPVPTICQGGAIGVSQPALSRPLLLRANASEKSAFNDAVQSVDRPMGTIVTKDCRALAEPVLSTVQHGEADERCVALERPLPTITSKGSTMVSRVGLGLAEPMIAQMYGSNIGKDGTDPISDPISTITAGGKHQALVEPIVATMYGIKGDNDDDGRVGSVCDTTLGTVVAGGKHHAIAEPFLIPNFGERQNQQPRVHSITAPAPTVTSHGAGVLIDVTLPEDGPFFLYDGQRISINILYRMLHSTELAAAHSLGHVRFAGSEAEATKMVGNSIPAKTAAAMIGHVIYPVIVQSTPMLELAA